MEKGIKTYKEQRAVIPVPMFPGPGTTPGP